MKAKRPAGMNFLFSAALFSSFLFFSGLNAKGQSQSTCVQSGTGVWQNHGFTGQSSQFVVTYSATPSYAAMNGVVGFSVNAANSLTSLAIIVRFASTGAIDVRNGGSFSAATSYPYTAGTQYAFQLAINPATKRYSVFVTAPGHAQVELASNYAFRSSQSGVSSLNNWATYSKGGTETVCNMTIAGAGPSVTAPTISAQPASKTVTAGQTATFSVTASGTAPLRLSVGQERRRHKRSNRGQLYHAGHDQHGQRIAIRGDRLEFGGKRRERSRDFDGNLHPRHA